MLDTLEHGVILTATTTLVLVVAIPLSPAAVDVIDLIHHTVTQMTKLDWCATVPSTVPST